MKKLAPIILSIWLIAAPLSHAARQLPVDSGIITSGIGWRLDPFGSGKQVYHHGVDISVPVGTPVYPTERGTVLYAGPYKGYGNLVAVDHGNGYVTIYGHNSVLFAKVGQKVDTATVIALSGNSGRSTGPHVHYEVRQVPEYDKKYRARLEEQLKAFVTENIEKLAQEQATGKGEGETEAELALPDDNGLQ